MTNGWCPFAERIPTPNFTPGNRGRDAFVMHIMDGTFQNSLNWMRKVGTSAHFDIAKTGRIVQQVSINDSAWGNGLAYENGRWYTVRAGVKTRVNPSWPLLRAGVNPNLTTISMEHEGKSGDALTPEQRAASIRVLQWCRQEVDWTYQEGRTLIGHRHLDNVGRARCPGPSFDLSAFAMAGNGTANVGATTPLPALTFWRVRYSFGANVREAKRAKAPIALGGTRILHQDDIVGGIVETGEAVNGEGRWLWCGDGTGFIHLASLEAA